MTRMSPSRVKFSFIFVNLDLFRKTLLFSEISSNKNNPRWDSYCLFITIKTCLAESYYRP